MSEELTRLQRENSYLKARVAQLEDDVTDLTAEVTRLRQVLDTTLARRAAARPNPLSGGQ
jgi:regulator of replication initiation timing